LPFSTHINDVQPQITHQGSVVVIRPNERLTIGEAEADFNGTVVRLVGEGHVHVLVDMAGVRVMDSSGVDALIRTWQLTRQNGGEMKLVNLGPRIRTLLDITGLTKVWEIHTDAQRALSSFREERPETRA
jgi:anti-sigma B factor antagonist